MKYIDLVIDNKSNQTDMPYTYGCEDDSVCVGCRVKVPFAKGNRVRDGYVVNMAETPGEELKSKLKLVESIDRDVSLSEEMMETAGWMKTRYLCRYIDAIRLFIPAGRKAKRREVKNSLKGIHGDDGEEKTLTSEQEAVLGEINSAVRSGKHQRFLLHGITGSGKTEVYIRAAIEAVGLGRTVIVLVPEISLTGQIVSRFAARFPEDEIAILHSKLSSGERYDQWQRIRSGKVKVVIGARSAVFAPLTNIGLIVVDEEHESTYKSDFTPKYDAIEVALKRTGSAHNNGVLLLGSATPSVVTYKRAEQGIYRLLTLRERYNKNPLPHVHVVDMREEIKTGNRTVISGRLLDRMETNLEHGKQIMLFLNRRGYSTFISCRECGFVLKCPECGLSLTYHRDTDSVLCHYCGHREKIPGACPDCGSRNMRYFGTGTEKLQETVQELLPEAVTDRLDLDTVKKQGELNRKLRAFKKHETDILIGTQIIAKGLDFRNVGLVGIVAADVSLNIPDFRSPERTFQLVTQAAGRAGRGESEGEVIIQTYSPDNYAIRFAAKQDYEGFYKEEDMLREILKYPPYSDLYRIVFTADSPEAAAKGADKWYGRLKELLPEGDRTNLFAPQEAYMSRIRDVYRYSMLIKCPAGKRRMYSSLIEVIREEEKKERKLDYTAIVDINPYSFS
ncbi:MAG: primosomal protein N' [Firmicutes bacterium]|nr:primosomal protein N' [Bacillota bacterium]